MLVILPSQPPSPITTASVSITIIKISSRPVEIAAFSSTRPSSSSSTTSIALATISSKLSASF